MTIAMQSGPRRSQGFSLIELMVTVVIVGILAASSYPSYRNYVVRGQVTSATGGLSAMSANMERYFQDNRTYAPANGLPTPCAAGVKYDTFTVSCPNAPTAAAFQLQAVGSGSTNGLTYFIDQTGAQSSTATAGVAPKGWRGCGIAWETKAGQCP